MFRQSAISTLIIFILKFLVLHINASPIVSPVVWCNCIRIQDCIPHLQSLLNGFMDDSTIQGIRNAACGLTVNSEPLVCCPTNTDVPKARKLYDTNVLHRSYRTVKREPWVWDRRPLSDDDKPDLNSWNFVHKEHDFTATNLIDDYVDRKTQRNCPPILYKEKPSHFSKPFHKHSPPPYHPVHPYHTQHDNDFVFPDQPFHHPHHHHHKHHKHFHDYDDYGFGIHDDSGIGNRHRFGPPFFPATSESRPHAVHTRTTTVMPTTTTTMITTTTIATTPTPPMAALAPIAPTINGPNCGITLNERIIGGEVALPGEFPWITRIAYLNNTDGSIAYRCSGSFITESHILTAAHCVTNLDTELTLSHIRLVESAPGLTTSTQPENNLEIAATIVHPNFNMPRRANDIAIIRINRPQNRPVNYGIICLPLLTESENSTNNLAGTTGIVAGWSNNEDTEANDSRVRYLRLPIINNTDCASRYDDFRQGFAEQIISSMVCTQGQSNGTDVCRGDSGGPLMDDGSTALYNGIGRYTLLGIVAFGPNCGFTGLLPSVYMRVSEYVDWIRNNLA